MLQFDHLGIICREIDQGKAFLGQTLGIDGWTDVVKDPIQRVHVCFGSESGGMVYELVAPSEADSPVSNALKQRVSIMNHIAYRCPRLTNGATVLTDAGCMPITRPQPSAAYGGAPVQFFFSPLHHVVEIVEADRPFHGSGASR